MRSRKRSGSRKSIVGFAGNRSLGKDVVPVRERSAMTTLNLKQARQFVRAFGLKTLWQNPNPSAKVVYSADGKRKGRLTGAEHFCSIEGCDGIWLRVRWSDGKVTWPCTKAMFVTKDKQWQIMKVDDKKK
jgi:hypothetical protein